MSYEKESVGYLRYSGDAIEDGVFDMRKAGDALIGFDRILRHFIVVQNPEMKKIDFELPVKIEEGSWNAKVIIGTALVSGFAGKMGYLAAEDAYPIVKSYMQTAMFNAQKVIETKKHMKEIGVDKVKKTQEQRLEEHNILLENEEKEILLVSKEEYLNYIGCPEDIFAQNVEIVDFDTFLEIGVYQSDGKISTVSITQKDRHIFTSKKEKPLPLFQLAHGEIVTLRGKVGSLIEKESHRSMKFLYIDPYTEKEYTIECTGNNITQFKNSIISPRTEDFFQDVDIKGQVDRIDGNGKPKKISIQIITIEPVEKGHLFSAD